MGLGGGMLGRLFSQWIATSASCSGVGGDVKSLSRVPSVHTVTAVIKQEAVAMGMGMRMNEVSDRGRRAGWEMELVVLVGVGVYLGLKSHRVQRHMEWKEPGKT